MPRLTNFDTEPRSSYCYELETDNPLEILANAHTAADLHVRPVPLTALVSRAAGAANALRDTACLISRNENDSTLPALQNQFTSPNQSKHFDGTGNVLNLCIDSKPPMTVTFLTTARNKFINRLRLNMAGSNFRTTLRHYADK